MDDRMVADAFEQLVVRLDDGRAPGLDELRGRALRRRHRRARRTLLVAAGVLVVLGVGVAVRAGSDGDSERVEMRPDPTTTAATTTVPAAARPHPLTVGAIPDGLAFAGCGSMPQGVPIVYCRYDEPTSLASVDGLTIGVSEGAVDDRTVVQVSVDRLQEGDLDAIVAAVVDDLG